MKLATDDKEHPIPTNLRPIFEQIAAAFADGDYHLRSISVPEVAPIDDELAEFIGESIDGYGAVIAPLHPRVWDRSCYSRDVGGWGAIVDLTTEREKVSDLAMHARITIDPSLQIEIWSVHVP